jgi:hypothetical protein
VTDSAQPLIGKVLDTSTSVGVPKTRFVSL